MFFFHIYDENWKRLLLEEWTHKSGSNYCSNEIVRLHLVIVRADWRIMSWALSVIFNLFYHEKCFYFACYMKSIWLLVGWFNRPRNTICLSDWPENNFFELHCRTAIPPPPPLVARAGGGAERGAPIWGGSVPLPSRLEGQVFTALRSHATLDLCDLGLLGRESISANWYFEGTAGPRQFICFLCPTERARAQANYYLLLLHACT